MMDHPKSYLLLRLALSYRLQGNKLHEDLNSTTQFQVALARLLKTNSDEQTQMLNAINQNVQGVDSLGLLSLLKYLLSAEILLVCKNLYCCTKL